jgi:hypothetical protein
MNQKTATDSAERERLSAGTAQPVRDERPAPPSAPVPGQPDARGALEFFPPDRREELRATWLDIQSAFIDEPRHRYRGLFDRLLSL